MLGENRWVLQHPLNKWGIWGRGIICPDELGSCLVGSLASQAWLREVTQSDSAFRVSPNSYRYEQVEAHMSRPFEIWVFCFWGSGGHPKWWFSLRFPMNTSKKDIMSISLIYCIFSMVLPGPNEPGQGLLLAFGFRCRFSARPVFSLSAHGASEVLPRHPACAGGARVSACFRG